MSRLVALKSAIVANSTLKFKKENFFAIFLQNERRYGPFILRKSSLQCLFFILDLKFGSKLDLLPNALAVTRFL